MKNRESKLWKIVAPVALVVSIPLGYWVRKQYLGALLLEIVLCVCVPLFLGCLIRSFGVIVPALVFNIGLSGTIYYLAVTWQRRGEAEPFGSQHDLYLRATIA